MKSLAYAVAAVAAIVIVALGANALNRGNVGGPRLSPSESALTGCTPEAISASGEALTVGWCPTRPDGQQVLVAFRLTTRAAAWTNGEELVGQDFLYFRPYGYGMQPGGIVGVSVGGPTTVDVWLALITGEAMYSVSEPLPISLGGANGYLFDVSLAEGFTDAPPLIENGTFSWDVDDRTTRVWLVDHDGQPVMFVTKPNYAGVHSWAWEVGGVLDTIEWTPTSTRPGDTSPSQAP